MTQQEMISWLRKLQAEGFREADYEEIASEIERLSTENRQLREQNDYLEKILQVYMT